MKKNRNLDVQPNSAFEAASNQQGVSAFEISSGSAFESDEYSAQSQARSRTFSLKDSKGTPHTLWGEEILRNQGAMSIVSTAWLQEGPSVQKVLIKRIQEDVNPNKSVLFSNEALITCENGSRGRHLAHGKFRGTDSQGRSFLVMEYYEGNNLEKKIDAGVYETNPERCKAVIRGILEGLVELHDQGIVHRDLKPANIIVRSDNGVPVLLDFGLACKTNLRDLNVCTIGTFGYAAPEQQDGAAEHAIAFSADVYSVGVILLEMLTPGFSVLKAGKKITAKIDRNDPQRVQKLRKRLEAFSEILNEQIAKLDKNNAGVFKNFILKCLEWTPEKRFQSGQEALDHFMSVAAQFCSEQGSELDAANCIVKGAMTDPRDGKTYKTVKIGSKIWLAENLGYKTPNSLCYDNDEDIANKYGRLYTLSDAKKASPPGWRLPSKKDIEELVAAAGGERVAGKKLKSASGWQANNGKNGNGVDSLGFSALPAGGKLTDSENPDDPEKNGFFLIGEKFDFWYDSGMLELYNHSNCADIEPFHIDYVDNFYSIRCIKDESVKPVVQQPKQNIPIGNSFKKNVTPKKSKAPVIIGILVILVILFFIVVAVVYSNKSDGDSSADNQNQIENVVKDSRNEDLPADNQIQNDSVLKMYLREVNTCDTVENGVDSTSYAKDEDKDGEHDYQDKSPNTLRGMKIDKKGINVKSGTTVLTEPSYKPVDEIEKNENAALVMRDIPDFTIKEDEMETDGESDYQDKDKDGVLDYLDKCPNTLRGVEINKRGCPVNENEDFEKLKKGISFESGTTVLNLRSYRALNDIMKLLTKFPDVNLEIQSHTDNSRDEENNMNLSQARAQSVVDYLIHKGIDKNRLRAVGFGGKKPIADNNKKTSRAKNSRVELVPYYQDQ